MLSQSLSNSKAQIFMLQEHITLFLSKNVLIVMFLILINKNVFEPRYHDLKFMVQNSNYVCTTLNTLHLTPCDLKLRLQRSC